ncbi:MAG TPA: NAD(P)H nitroreductase [Mycobacterium sp.]|nr:NAD(P)H nitroreductase [Mycobacterium sp.]
MFQTTVDVGVIKRAVELACRAPSLHNSQPWRWVFQGGVLDLFADRSRIGSGTDSTGREVLISCGAALDHLRVAMSAVGWQTCVDRLSDPNDRDHLASLDFQPADTTSDAQRSRADAIRVRRTDRRPFAAPEQWDSFEPVLRATVDSSVAELEVIDEDGRSQLAEASLLSEHVRRNDDTYHAELHWWTTRSGAADGIPPSALPSQLDEERVDVGRDFPTSGAVPRRADVEPDRSKVVVLSTYDDSSTNALGCGEALSAVLLECTMAGLATCTLTHMIEVNASREIVRHVTGKTALPQLLIRIGIAHSTHPLPPPTPRRRLSDVLEVR